ncbi:sulfotransferase [Pseudoalteromonas sp. JBTF-M23]|uniref:Sulfotransferase n=1 Tax=Pseudoalteromonas caenipelagi TaxID=2726988 RepID=A0A849VEY7_9GAMM|nr:sulfotransferase [Pseudoalteromonas caenipelagi]
MVAPWIETSCPDEWAMSQRPNLFIVGAPRSGTSALYLSLKQHPEVSLSVLKEPHFLADDLPIQPHTLTDWQDYQSLFNSSDTTIRGEGSVWYLSSQHAPKHIAELNPDAKVIVLLRRPWEQIQSLHSLYLRTGNEEVGDLERAIDLAAERAQGRYLPNEHYFSHGLNYLENTHYAKMLSHYGKYFKPEQLCVLLFDDYRQDNLGTLAKVCDFLQISRYSNWAKTQSEGQQRVRSTAIKQIKNLAPHVRNKIHPKLVHIHKTTSVSEYSADYLAHLKLQCKEQVADLSELLSRDLCQLWYS